MALGAAARAQGDFDSATALFEIARRAAPADVAATLELAVTREWARDPEDARALYAQALQTDPASRAAKLGLARTARAQYRLDAADEIYQGLLQADAHDLDAMNGLAWIALARRRTGEARHGFDAALAADPANAEAREGLRGVETTFPYQLDATVGGVRTRDGHASSAALAFRAEIDATHAVDVGLSHYSDELPSPQLTTQTPLPSNDLRLAYSTRVPDGYHWSLIYDYREHQSLPDEQRIEARAGSYFAGRLQWFASVRQDFGARIWRNRLLQAGLVLPLSGRWEIAPTLYYEQDRSPHDFDGNGRRNVRAYGVDLNRQGPGNSFFNAGAGYSPDISNVNLHTRWVIPTGRQGALLLAIEHVSVNDELLANVGWRFYWQ
ncbi:tetratricopeptide repeat protein [Tahibacter sp. UC22_41]|uniref:tetratricopeptide repeat protein n=1 Tax=Tahibacter sp. UC22_41 TaxID=3350178 RepID=UPI0036D8A5B3